MATGGELVPVNQVEDDIQWLAEIGSGSFGVVQKARINGHICAVKTLKQPLQQKTYERFIQECELMKFIRHDNVVQCLGVTHHNCPFLVMELMDHNLRQYLEASESPVHYYTQIDIASNIFQAIAYLHRNNIIHRDLSSANVLMKGNFAKVTDFGMARLFPDVNPCDLTKSPGTRVYMPPEALCNPPEYNETIDIFSSGVLLIQIQTRKFPKPNNIIINGSNAVINCTSEIQRRADHIAECEKDNPLLEIALYCLADKKDRPTAQRVCESLTRIQHSDKYISDKSRFEKNIRLSMRYDLQQILQQYEDQSQMISQQCQIITEAEKNVSTLQLHNRELQVTVQRSGACIEDLQSQVTQLQRVKEVGEREMVNLRSEMEILQKSKREGVIQIQNLQSRVGNLELELIKSRQQVQEQVQHGVEQLWQPVQQQVADYIQQMQSKSDKEKHQLQVEKEQISQQAKEKELALEGRISEFESLSGLSLSTLSLQDSRSESQASHHEKSLNFVSGDNAPRPMHRWSSAVVHGEAIYVTPGRTKLIYKYQNNSWIPLPNCQAGSSSLAFVDDQLVTIGGQLYHKNEIVYTGTVYSLRSDGTWIEAFPPMQTERDSVIAITSGKALIVAGGRGASSNQLGRPFQPSSLTTVEILCTETKVWQFASQLPFPLYHASATICGDSLFILGGQKSICTCKVADLILSLSRDQESVRLQRSSVWSQVRDLPVSGSTCITLQGHLLLAVGGVTDDHKPSSDVYCYDEELDCWSVLSQLLQPREACFAAVLSNRLYVIGGKEGSGRLHSSMEIGTLWS